MSPEDHDFVNHNGVVSHPSVMIKALDHGLSGGGEMTRRWARAIEDYCEWLRSGTISEATVRQRRYQLALLAEDHLSRNPWRLSGGQLSAWLASYEWSDATRATYRSTLVSFYTWGLDDGRVKHNPTERLRTVSIPDRVPNPAPDSVMTAALQRANDRDRLMLLLASHAGLRRAEIAGLRWDQIIDGRLRIVGKGKKTRVVRLTRRLAAELEAERQRRADGGYGTGYHYRINTDQAHVFPGRYTGHLTPETVGVTLSGLLGPGWTGHTLRHRFGSQFYRKSGDIRLTAAALGHSKLDTAAGYAALPSGAHDDVMANLYDDEED